MRVSTGGTNTNDQLYRQFRRDIVASTSEPPSAMPAADEVDLRAMAAAALNYLRGNPNPARNYECQFSLGPLGIPCHVPLLASNQYAFDPIALGDTDNRMYWQYPHMREMVGEPAADDVERGVRRRIRSYQRDDGLLWMNPAAWVGTLSSPSALAGLQHEWAFTWASGKWLVSLAEEFVREGNADAAAEARRVFHSLVQLVSRDGHCAFLPYGSAPWHDGAWLHLRDSGKSCGWGGEASHNYPFLVEPLVRYWECCGDEEALTLARAVADGHLAGVQPDMEELRIDPQTGAFARHVHLHTHEVWGVAHLGAVTGDCRYLDWAERAYRFVVSQGTDYGWYPEYIPQAHYRTEICVVGDMVSIAAWLARGGKPEFWDHVERAVRNQLRRSQFFLTPAFVALFREIHQDAPSAAVESALAELRNLEGGFVAQSSFDDWVGYPDNPKLGTPGLNRNGIQMMGCCPPEGMRGLWEAWQGSVEPCPEGIFVNLAFSRDHPAARVTAFRPGDGGIAIEAKVGGDFFLRPPDWTERDAVTLLRGDNAMPTTWGGPADAYVRCRDVRPGERLTLRWPTPQFRQVFVPQSVPGRTDTLTVDWLGNEVLAVTPRGKYLPMFGTSERG
ncbi:MAG TPA: hypothetical protein VGM23_01755 [Armatimonadota bacterium]